MTQRILIVDDDPLIREFVTATLSSVGYVVEGAQDGEKGLAALRKQRADLVLLDAAMPVLNGFDTLVKLKGDAALRDIPVSMLTALRAEKDVRRALALGVASYLVKPLASRALIERVKHALRDGVQPTPVEPVAPTLVERAEASDETWQL